MDWWLLAMTLSGVAAVLAWCFAHHRRAHVPVAVFITLNVLADVARRAIQLFVLDPAKAAHPALPFAGYTGLARVAFNVSEPLFLAWPAGLAWIAALVFLEKRQGLRAARIVLGVYVAVSAIFVAAYPALRQARLATAVLGVELAALAGFVAAGLAWCRRWSSWSEAWSSLGLTEGSVVVVAAIELGVVSRWRPAGWDVQLGLYVVLFAALIVLHGVELWAYSTESTSA